MKVYEIKYSELKKYDKEFKKTVFGKRIRVIYWLLVALFIISIFGDAFAGEMAVEYWIISFTTLVGVCLTELHYDHMLKEYIDAKLNSKKK